AIDAAVEVEIPRHAAAPRNSDKDSLGCTAVDWIRVWEKRVNQRGQSHDSADSGVNCENNQCRGVSECNGAEIRVTTPPPNWAMPWLHRCSPAPANPPLE